MRDAFSISRVLKGLLLTVLVGTSASQAQAQIPFDLDRPAFRTVLSDHLEEISGLSWDERGFLLAVQDEQGHLFQLSPETGEIAARERFWGGGDYEGVERIEAWTYVLESNGKLYRTPAEGPDRSETLHVRLDLPSGCDAEGLSATADGSQLLVACKEADGVKGARGRSVWAFELTGESASDSPALFWERDLLEERGFRGLGEFRPSALAVDPATGELYVLVSHDPALCVARVAGPECVRLSPDFMPQPEGLAFDPGGNLWIASEARGTKPRLLRFDRIRPTN